MEKNKTRDMWFDGEARRTTVQELMTKGINARRVSFAGGAPAPAIANRHG